VQHSLREKYKEGSISSRESGTNGTNDYMSNKERYDIFRHHAWAGTVLLSVLLAVRYMIPQFPHYLFTILCTLLIVYIVLALFYTFKYRRGLSERAMTGREPDDTNEEKQQAKIDKELLKIDKKKAKAETKQRKKDEKQSGGYSDERG